MVATIRENGTRYLANGGLVALTFLTFFAVANSVGWRIGNGPEVGRITIAGTLALCAVVFSLLTPVDEHGIGTRIVCGITSFVGCWALWAVFAAWRDCYGDFPALAVPTIGGILWLAGAQKRRLFFLSVCVFLVAAIFPAMLPGTPVSDLQQRQDLPFRLVKVYRINGFVIARGLLPSEERLFSDLTARYYIRPHWRARVLLDQSPLLESGWLLNYDGAVLSTKSGNPAEPAGSVRPLFFTRSVHVIVRLQDLWKGRSYELDLGRVAIE